MVEPQHSKDAFHSEWSQRAAITGLISSRGDTQARAF